MGTMAQGDRMTDMILKYRKGKPVESNDRELLDDLHRAAIISYSIRNGVLYAEASPISRKLVPRISTRMKAGN